MDLWIWVTVLSWFPSMATSSHFSAFSLFHNRTSNFAIKCPTLQLCTPATSQQFDVGMEALTAKTFDMQIRCWRWIEVMDPLWIHCGSTVDPLWIALWSNKSVKSVVVGHGHCFCHGRHLSHAEPSSGKFKQYSGADLFWTKWKWASKTPSSCISSPAASSS